MDKIHANISIALQEDEMREQTEAEAATFTFAQEDEIWEQKEAAAFTPSHATSEQETQTEQTIQETHGTQTDEVRHADPIDDHSTGELNKNQKKNQPQFGISIIKGNDKATSFYAGLPTWPVFLSLFMFLSPFATSVSLAVSLENQLFLTLARLRLNLLY